jgi:hypothetical protein
MTNQTYYGSLEHVCKAIVDRQASMVDTLDELMTMMAGAAANLEKEVSVLF